MNLILKESMQKVIVILLLLVQMFRVLILFSQNTGNNRTQLPIGYALFTAQSDVDFAFYRKNYKSFRLSKAQFSVVQSIIKRVSDSLDFLNTSKNVNTGIIDTLKYAFQIVSAINNQRQIYLWVNAICGPNKEWRSRLIFVDDGGSCYYRYRINLKTKQYFDIQINAGG